jgi:replicative DNA helicase
MSAILTANTPDVFKSISNIELEEHFIGCLIMQGDMVEVACSMINENVFYSERVKAIYKAMMLLRDSRKEITLVTVTQLVISKHSEFFGTDIIPYEISRMTNGVTHVHERYVEQLAQKLIEYAIKRMNYAHSIKLHELSTDPSVDFDTLNELNDKFNLEVSTMFTPFKDKRYEEMMFDRISRIISNDGSQPMGLMTQFPSLDNIIGCLHPVFILLCARPAMGKTAFMVQLMRNLSQQAPVGIIELETNSDQYLDRHIANITGIDSFKLKKGGLLDEEKERLSEAMTEVMNGHEIFSSFESLQNYRAICSKIRRWVAKGCKAVLIDYVQIIGVGPEDEKKTREQQVSKLANVLQALAKELNIPIIALAQLSREVAKRSDKRPNLADIRESGQLEQAARMIMFLHRPEYYEVLPVDEDGKSIKGISEVIVAKNNEGDLGTARLYFEKHLSKYVEVSEATDVWRPPVVDDDAPF